MKTNPINIHSQKYMGTMARLMSEALESPNPNSLQTQDVR